MLRQVFPLALIGATVSFSVVANAEQLRVVSTLPGYKVAAMNDLPPNPYTQSEGQMCDLGPPQTESGKMVASAGWHVSDEIEQGENTYVSFAGRAIWGTGGICSLEEGNVAIFRSDALVAIIYGTEGDGDAVGRIRATGPNSLRVSHGSYSMSSAGDLTFDPKNGFSLGPMAERDSFCEGRVSIPNLTDKAFGIARELFIEEGWRPPGDLDLEASRNGGDMWTGMDRSNCSGTGVGYCYLDLVREGGQSMTLLTAGETADDGPLIIWANVDCS